MPDLKNMKNISVQKEEFIQRRSMVSKKLTVILQTSNYKMRKQHLFPWVLKHLDAKLLFRRFFLTNLEGQSWFLCYPMCGLRIAESLKEVKLNGLLR